MPEPTTIDASGKPVSVVTSTPNSLAKRTQKLGCAILTLTFACMFAVAAVMAVVSQVKIWTGPHGTATQVSDILSLASSPSPAAVPDDEPSVKAPYPGAKKHDRLAVTGTPLDMAGWQVTVSPLTRSPGWLSGTNLCSTVTMKNMVNREQRFMSINWTLQTASGTTENVVYTGSDNDLSSGTLVEAGHTEGEVCFTDKHTGPGLYVLIWKPSFDTERGIFLSMVK